MRMIGLYTEATGHLGLSLWLSLSSLEKVSGHSDESQKDEEEDGGEM